ncbi:MAG: hypothetical protein ACOZNI_30915 [Myxococcota bacterium]
MLWLVGCGVDWVDRGPREAPDEVTWRGWVYTYPPSSEDTPTHTGGTLVLAPDGSDPIEAEEPYVPDYPGYWQAVVPAGVPVTLRIEGEGLYPAVWAGDTPTGDAIWLNGYLFGADAAYMESIWAALPLPAGVAVPPGRQTVAVWGTVPDGEAWSCETMVVGDDRPYCVAVGDDGTLTRVDAGPFDYFFAFGLPEGDVLVDSGTGAAETYPAEGGDVVMAFWLREGA